MVAGSRAAVSRVKAGRGFAGAAPGARRATRRWRRRTRPCGRRHVAGQPEPPGVESESPLLAQLGQHHAVVGGIDHDPDVVVVLGRGAHHGRAADVDEFDRRVRGERVEVADHQVDEADAQLVEGVEVLGLGAVGEDAAVDDRVEGLDPAPEHLGGAGQVGHLDVVDARRGQGGRRAAARDQFPTQLRKPGGQFDQSGLVVDGQQSPHGATSSVVSPPVDPRPSPTPAARSSTKRRMVSG